MNEEDFSLNRTPAADWFARIVAILSLLIGVAGVIHSIWTSRIAEIEVIAFKINRESSNYATEIQSLPLSRGGPAKGTISAYWELVFVNKSKKKVQLVEYSLK